MRKSVSNAGVSNSGDTDLVDFLLSRIGDDEVAIHKARVHGWSIFEPFTTEHLLAQCEAKRRIINQRGGCSDYTLGLLALPYADHPDYREEWKR